jgi:predicted DNA-binding transcriptional regulator YafY
MERLVRIAAVLRVAGDEGVSARKLIAVGDYRGSSVEDLLSRDLRALRNQGWEIVSTGGPGSDGHYRMVTVDNRFRVRLTPQQLSALRRAVLLVDREDLAARLGLPETERPSDLEATISVSGLDERLATVVHGVRHRCLLRFRYNGRDRVVHPHAARTQFGTWYLLGHEDASDVSKYFVVSRMGEVHPDEPGTAAEAAASRYPTLHPMRWEVDPEVEVTLRTDPAYVADVERWIGEPIRRTDGPDGVDLVFAVTNRAALRARLYQLGLRVSVVAPDDVRRELLDDLAAWTAQSPRELPA